MRFAGWSPLYWLFGHRMTDGRLGGVAILLHTVGRRTGEVRTVVLPAFERAGSLLVCATLGGGPRDPLWVANLAANPAAEVRVRRRLRPVTARSVTGDERAALLGWMIARHPGFGLYQAQADQYGRVIPVIALEPRGAA